MKKDNIKYRFLLGGYDLEMITIRDLLDEYGCRYEDRNLKWGAKLSAYADLFNEEDYFAGVELIEDVSPPPNYLIIDHHNHKNNLPSSLEQIAELLGHELTRDQYLIAVNDRGYIPALEAMGISKKEIDEIRKADRNAQGIKERDEELAEISIKDHLSKNKNITIVESLTPRFSPITDRLFPLTNLLICHDTQFIYYGKGVNQLARKYYKLVKQSKAYYGGGDSGFFGLAKNAFNVAEFTELKNEVIDLINTL